MAIRAEGIITDIRTDGQWVFCRVQAYGLYENAYVQRFPAGVVDPRLREGTRS